MMRAFRRSGTATSSVSGHQRTQPGLLSTAAEKLYGGLYVDWTTSEMTPMTPVPLPSVPGPPMGKRGGGVLATVNSGIVDEAAPASVFDLPNSGKERPGSTPVAWSDCLVDSSHGYSSSEGGIGLRFRGPVAGPEQELVEAFLSTATIHLRPGRSLTVFAEPAIDTGFPDLVAIVWRRDVASGWSAERGRLRAMDLRLLHLLATRGSMELSFLQQVFQRGLHGMLARLEEANVVSVGKSMCQAHSTQNIFAIERIIAIEAKVTATQRALDQAGANTWFSSESHALLPRPRTGERLLGVASSLGVGVLSFEHNRVTKVCAASTRSVPLSYGSWLFNEWAWRIAFGAGAT